MKELYIPYRNFRLQTAYINDLINSNFAGDVIPHAVCEYSLIALQDAWNCFIRDVILISAVQNTVTKSGRVYSASPLKISNFDEVLSILQQQWISKSGRISQQQAWWEPNWYNQHAGTTACNILRLSNRDISAAISTLTNPIEELRPARNFVAHKGRGTKQKIDHLVSSRGLPLKWHRVDDVAFYRINHNEYLIQEWMRRFNVVAQQFI